MRWMAAAALVVSMAACAESSPVPVSTEAPVPVSPTTAAPSVTTARPEIADVNSLVNDAAAAACVDGVLTPAELADYTSRLRDLGVDPGSASSRTAIIVACGLTTADAIDRLP